ncbi:MAG: sugar phosphate isomerase/epimerase [Dehalococcoidia bacterium]
MGNMTTMFGVSSSLCRGEVRRLPKPVESLSEEDAVAVYLALLERFTEFVLEQGFDAIEIELGFSMIKAADLVPAVEQIRKRTSRFRTVSCHLPLGEINISALHPGVRRHSVDETKGHIDLCAELEIAQLVAHPGSFAGAPDRYLLLPHQTKRTAEMSILEISDYCREKHMALSVENLHRGEPLFRNPEDFEPFVREGLGITLDVAHAFGSGVDPLDFIARFGSRITEVHLSDGVDSNPQSHYPLGTGQVDCLAILRELEQVGFGGTIVIEVDSTEDLIGSKMFLQQNGYLA